MQDVLEKASLASQHDDSDAHRIAAFWLHELVRMIAKATIHSAETCEPAWQDKPVTLPQISFPHASTQTVSWLRCRTFLARRCSALYRDFLWNASAMNDCQILCAAGAAGGWQIRPCLNHVCGEGLVPLQASFPRFPPCFGSTMPRNGPCMCSYARVPNGHVCCAT